MRRGTAEYFWSNVDKSDECWIWKLSLDRKGYGRVRFRGAYSGAHRVAYQLSVGPIPDGLELDHLCRVTACVNPAHLEPVTHEENMRRAAKTQCPRGHEYSEDNIEMDQGKRRCRTCRNAQARARMARVRASRNGG